MARPRRAAVVTGLRILLADDSVVARRLIAKALSGDAHVAAVETASNGRIALDKLASFAPDVVILDVDMPGLDGLATLAALRQIRADLPVVMFGALSGPGARAAFDALRMGAVDCVRKPTGFDCDGGHDGVTAVQNALLPLLHGLKASEASSDRAGAAAPATMAVAPITRAATERLELVVIGVSTGGPYALGQVVSRLPDELAVPVVIAQHLPAAFTGMLAERLDRGAGPAVREAVDGAPVASAQVWIAPGGRHLRVRRDGTVVRLAIGSDAPVNGCRPSVDVLIDAAVDVYGGRALAAIMTGMGHDGLQGCARLRSAGGQVIAQDHASSVVWGMPGAVVRAGLAQAVVPLDRLAAEITRRVTRVRAA